MIIMLQPGDALRIGFADVEGKQLDGMFRVDFDSSDYPKSIMIREVAGLPGSQKGGANEILYHEGFSHPPEEEQIMATGNTSVNMVCHSAFEPPPEPLPNKEGYEIDDEETDEEKPELPPQQGISLDETVAAVEGMKAGQQESIGELFRCSDCGLFHCGGCGVKFKRTYTPKRCWRCSGASLSGRIMEWYICDGCGKRFERPYHPNQCGFCDGTEFTKDTATIPEAVEITKQAAEPIAEWYRCDRCGHRQQSIDSSSGGCFECGSTSFTKATVTIPDEEDDPDGNREFEASVNEQLDENFDEREIEDRPRFFCCNQCGRVYQQSHFAPACRADWKCHCGNAVFAEVDSLQYVKPEVSIDSEAILKESKISEFIRSVNESANEVIASIVETLQQMVQPFGTGERSLEDVKWPRPTVEPPAKYPSMYLCRKCGHYFSFDPDKNPIVCPYTGCGSCSFIKSTAVIHDSAVFDIPKGIPALFADSFKSPLDSETEEDLAIQGLYESMSDNELGWLCIVRGGLLIKVARWDRDQRIDFIDNNSVIKLGTPSKEKEEYNYGKLGMEKLFKLCIKAGVEQQHVAHWSKKTCVNFLQNKRKQQLKKQAFASSKDVGDRILAAGKAFNADITCPDDCRVDAEGIMADDKRLGIWDWDGHAFRVKLSPERMRTMDATASLDRWIMYLPRQSPLWKYYVLTGSHLRDEPGMTPAKKKSLEVTHEIIVAALDPEFPEEKIKAGSIRMLEPLNYVYQFECESDEKANEVLEYLAGLCVGSRLIAEMQGMQGMKELWNKTIEMRKEK